MSHTVDPSKVCIVTPTHDGNVCAAYAGGLISCAGLFGGVSFIRGHSNVALARCVQAAAFINSPFEWLLSIDADIQFARSDMQLLYEGDEQIRVAEYAKKELPPKKPARFGMGFALIHRSVFEALDEIVGFAMVAEDSAPFATPFEFEGVAMREYFQTGVDQNTRRYVGEDRFFFGLCQRAKCSVRVETRTRLVHWGAHGFQYEAPQMDMSELQVQP